MASIKVCDVCGQPNKKMFKVVSLFVRLKDSDIQTPAITIKTDENMDICFDCVNNTIVRTWSSIVKKYSNE